MQIERHIEAQALLPLLKRFWAVSAAKLRLIDAEYDPSRGSPVFTANGKYTTRGWTEWTQGFQYGAWLLQFDATDEVEWIERGRGLILEHMAPHLTHTGVHDHGFNNVSTYGNLLRLMNEGRIPEVPWERRMYVLALKCSAAVQASRWTPLRDGSGFIYSFNGPHSLFADTIRSLRVLALGHRLGHVLMAENDTPVSLLERLVAHARTTAAYSVYYGKGRDAYDVRGRVAHESIFNINDGRYRCPNSQQGFSPFTTWTRGLAWVMLGFAEQLEFLETCRDEDLVLLGGREDVAGTLLEAAYSTCDFYLANTAADGVPYWDTGAPELHRLGDWRTRPAEPFNDWEPVDSSAAAIAAQGLLRLGRYLRKTDRNARRADAYLRAGLALVRTLIEPPYLALAPDHQGLLLHSVYHRPNGWDFVPAGRQVPCGESSMWGDYHLREAALLAQRLAEGKPYLTFWGPSA
ncbi:MAG: glycosyl hydrolase [Kiritimatiellaeota bacterium]|nr:glycosyl hydrolase [Kiritimatiellota bacterium]